MGDGAGVREFFLQSKKKKRGEGGNFKINKKKFWGRAGRG